MNSERPGLSEEAAALLDAAREEYSPQDHELARVEVALKAKLTHASVSFCSRAEPPASTRMSAWQKLVQYALHSASWQWLTATALASGLAAGAATFGPLASDSSPRSDEQLRTGRVAQRVAAPRLPKREPAVEQPTTQEISASADNVAAGGSAREQSNVEPRPSRAEHALARARESTRLKSGPRAATEQVLGDDSLEHETALLRQARERFEARDANDALRLLEQHAARFPRGALRQEQLYLRVLALCALERSEDARGVARALSTSAGSLYRQRLARTCVKP